MRPIAAGGGGVRSVRTALRALVSPGALCLLLGLAGGLLLGYVLSREGGWMTPAPWAIYLVALLAAIAAVSWFDERRRAHTAAAVAKGGAARVATDAAADDAAPPANVIEFRRDRSAEGTAVDGAGTTVPDEVETAPCATVSEAEKTHEEVAGEC